MNKCSECGHFSIIKDVSSKSEIVEGCTGVKLILDEADNYFKNVTFKDNDNLNKTFEFDAIDTQFTLNKNNDCFLWVKQTDSQKEILKKERKKKIKNKLKDIVKCIN